MLVLIHFNPIDKYPPAVNFIRYISQQSEGKFIIEVVTTAPQKTNWNLQIPGVVINRVVTLHSKLNRFQRVLKYTLFNLKALYKLWSLRPSTVLYYETLSAWAPYIYVRWLNKSSKLFIHYHEYTSPAEYENGMLLNKYLHKLECKLYERAVWISHTNKDRLEMFLKDIKPVTPINTFILPNYPPTTWKRSIIIEKKSKQERVGFVYVGALSLDTMYTKQMAEFVAGNRDRFYWHIYSENHQEEAIEFLYSLNADNIQFNGSVKYDDLPSILPNYDVGVILYKGHIPNYIYNAPNKLFEYYACGLTIWFPDKMKGAFPYICSNRNQSIIPVDFENLNISSIDKLRKPISEDLPCSEYFCEDVLEPLWSQIKKENKNG